MPCDPLRDLRAWQERLERLAAVRPDSWSPPVDVYETADRYVITAELPGLTRDDVELAVEDTRLTIRGRRADAGPGPGDARHYHQMERGYGGFARTFDFPDRIDAPRVSATLNDGVLTVVIPKEAQPPARRIEVG
jgi:HSP20 family protein